MVSTILSELTQQPPTVETATRSKASRAALVFIFATVLFDTLGFGIIIPVLPGLVVSFVQGDPARGAEIFGLFGTTWALMQFLFAPLLGALSDRYGRRPVLILSAFGLGIDYIIMALAPNSLLFLLAIIFYAPIGFVQPALQGLMTRRVGPSEQGALQGINGSLMGLTGVIGPTLFTLLFAFFIGSQAPVNLPGAPFLLSALLMISSLILAVKVTRSRDQTSIDEDLSNRIESRV